MSESGLPTQALVSVIIPVHNGERYLAEALESVLAQDYVPIEIILVDDGSLDDTARIASCFPTVIYLHQEQQGPAAARNAGVQVARGEFLAFLDADDLWTRDKLVKQVAMLREHPQVGLVVCHLHPLLEPGAHWPASLNQAHYESDPPAFLPSALVMRRIVWEQVGTFDTAFQLSEDADWFFRARDMGQMTAVWPEVLLHKRIHDRNLSHQIQIMEQELLRALYKSLGRKKRRGSE